MTYEEAVQFISGLRRHGMKLGNDRMRALTAALGEPQRRYLVAHVTGTKGKGSTTAMIAAILRAHGLRCGGYYSPYVYNVRERVTVDGEMISEADFAGAVARLRPLVEEIRCTPLGDVTEFEAKTALAFAHFADVGVDCAAVEVGIGGRLDATNVVDPAVTVITNVGLDHTEILGSTLQAIAWEKAGIIKPSIPLVTAVGEPEALDTVFARASELHSGVVCVPPAMAEGAPTTRVIPRPDETFDLETPRNRYRDLKTRMPGDYQRTNAACAVCAAEEVLGALRIAPLETAVRDALAEAYLPGRLDTLRMGPRVIADGAHNALAAQALAVELAKIPRRRLLLVVGMLRGHDPDDVLRSLARHAAVVFATAPKWKRAAPAELLADHARRYCSDVRCVASPLDAALAALAEAEPEDLILITGSFYTVGDVPAEALRTVPL